jgi:ABC-2 type transport system ATP-binding protein
MAYALAKTACDGVAGQISATVAAVADSYSELRQATKRFGPVTALRGVDVRVRKREVMALLGPNGAGKTTAIRLMLGLAEADSGTARLFGTHPRSLDSRRRTGVMFQVAKLPETLRVREQIHMFSSYYPNPLPFSDVIRAAGLAGLENRLCGKLSGGQLQRVAFALAICGNPDLLFLDEPTAGLDVEARRNFWSSIRAFVDRGGSVLLTTHYLEEADALADRVAVINRGRITAEGTPSEIKSHAASSRILCLTRLDPATLAEIPGVQRLRTDKQRVEILTAQPEGVLRDLLARDPLVSGLEVTASGLEEAFLTLTQQDEGITQVVA